MAVVVVAVVAVVSVVVVLAVVAVVVAVAAVVAVVVAAAAVVVVVVNGEEGDGERHRARPSARARTGLAGSGGSQPSLVVPVTSPWRAPPRRRSSRTSKVEDYYYCHPYCYSY